MVLRLPFLIKLEFGKVGFCGEGKTGMPGEKPLKAKKRTNNKLNSPTKPPLVGDECSRYCATIAPSTRNTSYLILTRSLCLLYIWICVSQVGEHISLGICVSQVGEYISPVMCLPRRGTHITRDISFPGREHTSLEICVSQVGEHTSPKISVSQVGEHISLGICVSQVGEHTSLARYVFLR